MSRPLDVERIAELERRNNALEGINVVRGRVAVGVLTEGLQALLLGAQGGDAGAQQDLKTLRGQLRAILDSESDVRSRIAVVRRPD